MKKPTLMFLTFILLVSACKKDKADALFYFTFKIGSKKYTIDNPSARIYIENDTVSKFDIEGNTTSYKYSLNAFGLNPLDTTTIGTYETTMSPNPHKILIGGGFISRNVDDENIGVYPINYDGKYSFTIAEKTS